MHLFSSMIEAAPGMAGQAGAAIAKFRDAGSAAHGLPMSAWAVVAGAPHGTYALTARVEGMDQLLGAFAAIGANEAWNDAVTESADVFSAPGRSMYAQMVGATSEDFGDSQLVSIVQATIVPAKMKEGLAHADEILHYAAKVTGVDGVLLLNDAGPVGQISWAFGVDSGAEADAANAALQADPEWRDRQAAGAELLQAGATERMYMARLP